MDKKGGAPVGRVVMLLDVIKGGCDFPAYWNESNDLSILVCIILLSNRYVYLWTYSLRVAYASLM